MRRYLIAAVPIATLLLASAAHAQSGRLPTRVVTLRPALTGACASLTYAPSELVKTPEGLAMLRLKRELEGVATVIEHRGPEIEGMDVRRISAMQRGLDSLVEVFVRHRTGDGPSSHTITMRRTDSTTAFTGRLLDGPMFFTTIDSVVTGIRPQIEIQLRAMGPQVAAFSSAGARVVKSMQTGYMGVNLSGAQIRMVSDSGSFTSHCDYPLIESVDVGSPARQAGLLAGDTIVAYNGRDILVQAINYPQMLVPGKVVRVKVRREGRVRDVPVTVSERPEGLNDVVRFATSMPLGVTSGQPARAPLARGGTMVRTTVQPSVQVASPSGSSSARVTGVGSSLVTVFGAQLNAVDDDFARTMDIEPGILVLRVQPGSPAADAGLRAGEMIRAVNGAPTRDLPLIIRAISQPGVRDVKLTVAGRDTPLRIVTVRIDQKE